MSGEWKRRRVEYSGTGNRKGRPTRKVHLNDRATPRLYPDRCREDGMGLYGLSFFNVTSIWLIPSLVENSLGRSVPPGSTVHHFRVPLPSS